VPQDSVSTNGTVGEQPSPETAHGAEAQEKVKHKRWISGISKKKSSKKKQKEDSPDVPVVFDFNQNVEQNHLAEASQQLLKREKHLFGPQLSAEEVSCTDDQKDSLHKDYETLMLHLWMAVNDSFNKENQEKLRSAVQAIGEQEEQDRHWTEADEDKHPCWRPLKCREIHDTMLKKIVEVRLQQANEEENGTDKLSTSLKREVCRMGKRIRKDLLHVVEDVQQCYTPEFGICNMYVQLYHQAFSTKLMEITRTNIELQDIAYILFWIHDYYPNDILQQNELKPHINTESLGALFPGEELKSLEKQYLSLKEVEVGTWLTNALKKEEEIWQKSDKLELFDGCFFSNLAVDVIPIVDGAMKEAMDILSNRNDAQTILLPLKSFLVSYKKSITELIKGKNTNITDNLKGSLVSIKQLREYIEKHDNLSDEVKETLLSILSEMKNSCDCHFLNPIHKDLKEHYRKLWTPGWLAESHTIIKDLLSILQNMVQEFRDIQPDCKKELLGQLHSEVMTKYVRRMLKGKLKLKDKDDQEAAARFLCEDSAIINTTFMQMGSEEKWLSRILPKLSEVVRLQDPGALQLEIVTLARAYPDISESQVLALLTLKANLSKENMRSIKKSLNEHRDSLSTEPTPAFFSKILVKNQVLRLTMINSMDTIKPLADTNTNNGNTACSKEHNGTNGDSISVVIIKETKKSSAGSAKVLNHLFKTKKFGKKHSSKCNPEHSGAVGASTEMVKLTSKSESSSAGHLLTLMLKTKKSGKKSSKSSPNLLEFSQNLEKGYLAEASQQLLEKEKGLFILQSSAKDESSTEDKIKALREDYEILMEHLKMAVHNSFIMDSQDVLRSAIMAIVQQEDQDRLWEEAAEEPPSWRPMRCLQIHDTILKEVVEIRLKQVNEEELEEGERLKREVLQIGSVIQSDLLQVVNHVQGCYSSDFNVCNIYAQLYHQAFSTKLRKLLQFSVTLEDYRFILQQINCYSKNILQQDELKPHIKADSLGSLLSEEDHNSLEEQYLSHKEKEVNTRLSTALKLKEADWQANKKPELDEYYFCNLAFDVIGVIDGAINKIAFLLGNEKGQTLVLQLDSFLLGYKNSMAEYLKAQQLNLNETLKAELFNISRIREYIEKQENLPDEVKVAWLASVSELRDDCHSYFLLAIHKELKVVYCKLWTPAWFSEHEKIIEQLEDTLMEKINSLKGLHGDCQKELLTQLHFEVMIEYVRRMLKRKLKLKNKHDQEAAAHFLCEDSNRINTLFDRNRSEKEWLSEILPRVSEVIKEQDPESLELEICVLLKHHPDL
ncbi:tumor necrosis factor alpha-induced protein 2-like, partial [Clarias magur]